MTEQTQRLIIVETARAAALCNRMNMVCVPKTKTSPLPWICAEPISKRNSPGAPEPRGRTIREDTTYGPHPRSFSQVAWLCAFGSARSHGPHGCCFGFGVSSADGTNTSVTLLKTIANIRRSCPQLVLVHTLGAAECLSSRRYFFATPPTKSTSVGTAGQFIWVDPTGFIGNTLGRHQRSNERTNFCISLRVWRSA